jgi:hypothetical protein
LRTIDPRASVSFSDPETGQEGYLCRIARGWAVPPRISLLVAGLVGFWSALPAEPATPVRANLAVQKVRLTDNGDNDGIADPNETVQVFVTLRNRSGIDRQGIVVQMASTDVTVACIPTRSSPSDPSWPERFGRRPCPWWPGWRTSHAWARSRISR